MAISRKIITALAATTVIGAGIPTAASAQAAPWSFPGAEALTAGSSAASAGVASWSLEQATKFHLMAMGHHRDEQAQRIAQDWANQAARGEAEFHGNVGRGITAHDRGTGNIYRMTPVEAAQRIAWLLNPTNRTGDGKGFGVSGVDAHGNVYLAEFFLH
ncbi:hypothetical protein [Corynebacterium sp.]|uniref:hypothetical protein n=1 Tax=Corynebacterium sp. TaxID=1720 RepID=UPI0027BA3001|nr:hypothetical protein [Corynebacterium sp.]